MSMKLLHFCFVIPLFYYPIEAYNFQPCSQQNEFECMKYGDFFKTKQCLGNGNRCKCLDPINGIVVTEIWKKKSCPPCLTENAASLTLSAKYGRDDLTEIACDRNGFYDTRTVSCFVDGNANIKGGEVDLNQCGRLYGCSCYCYSKTGDIRAEFHVSDRPLKKGKGCDYYVRKTQRTSTTAKPTTTTTTRRFSTTTPAPVRDTWLEDRLSGWPEHKSIVGFHKNILNNNFDSINRGSNFNFDNWPSSVERKHNRFHNKFGFSF